jgi:preprotein translocase subunit SecG
MEILMSPIQLILTIVYVLLAVVLVVIVTMQSGKSNGLSGAIGGGSAETFLAKNKSKSLDSRLAKLTKWVAIVFVVFTMVLCFVFK